MMFDKVCLRMSTKSTHLFDHFKDLISVLKNKSIFAIECSFHTSINSNE